MWADKKTDSFHILLSCLNDQRMSRKRNHLNYILCNKRYNLINVVCRIYSSNTNDIVI